MSSIELTNVTFAYGERTIFLAMSCRFDAGMMTSLVGPSGSGKSTLLALVMGQLRPAAGTISYPRELIRDGTVDPSKVAWVMQTSNVFSRRSALDNVALPIESRGSNPSSAREQAIAALDLVGLRDRIQDRSGQLSGGERQRVAVARALAVKAPVLIADEPTVSLDRENRDLLVSALKSVARSGAIVIVATHDPSVYRACEKLVKL